MMKERIKEVSVQKNVSVLEALKLMDKIGRKLLLVFEGTKFFGVLSIGDIQRAIIRNISLSSTIQNIMRSNVRVARVDDSFDSIKSQMIDHRIECMPVLDNYNNLVDAYFWDEIFAGKFDEFREKLEIPVVIMAGGRGERLKPITNVIPKPLIPVGDKPIIENIIDQFSQIGAKEFYITINYKSELIEYYFQSGKTSEDKSVFFIKEGSPLGTAGSLKLLAGRIRQTFFITNCDILIDQDYRDMYDYHVKNKNDMTLVVSMMHIRIPYGIIDSGENGILLSIKEKPEFTYKINTGVYLLEPDLLNLIPEGEMFHMTDLIDAIKAKNGKIGIFPVSEKSWRDIGDWKEYLKNSNISV